MPAKLKTYNLRRDVSKDTLTSGGQGDKKDKDAVGAGDLNAGVEKAPAFLKYLQQKVSHLTVLSLSVIISNFAFHAPVGALVGIRHTMVKKRKQPLSRKKIPCHIHNTSI